MVYVIEVVRFGGWEKDQTSFEHRGTYDECMKALAQWVENAVIEKDRIYSFRIEEARKGQWQ